MRSLLPFPLLPFSLLLVALAPGARASTVDVAQVGLTFAPANVNVHVGDTVRWIWATGLHTVTEGSDGVIDGNELFTGPLDSANPIFTWTFDAAFVQAHPMPGGVYHYFCAFHFGLGMVGTVTLLPEPGAGFCAGDGSGTACPCGNDAAAGAGTGCLSSLGQGGLLAATGTASVSADTLVLTGSGMPNSSALYFQGTAQQNGGAGTAFGDGLRCAAGTVVRLGTKANAAGTSSYPGAGDLAVSVRGACSAGDVRTYQVWYRNAAAFCTPSTFNLTNGYAITWQS